MGGKETIQSIWFNFAEWCMQAIIYLWQYGRYKFLIFGSSVTILKFLKWLLLEFNKIIPSLFGRICFQIIRQILNNKDNGRILNNNRVWWWCREIGMGEKSVD